MNATENTILIEVGAGELIDKLTILRIKSERMRDPAKLANVRHEFGVLSRVRDEKLPAAPELDRLEDALQQVNAALWEIEDAIRDCEARGDFGERFIELARSVYMQNDRRAELKKAINALCGSRIVEEKSYTEFR
ncbi:MAG: hypothetical protein CMN57_09880 [Gammaproteobacteria bacterium]|nr:hypothetical protein [Gammaproteobacteria bacterium]